jgi:hypothetical protein
MNQITYPVDNSAILYLALMRPKHTNIYRFTMVMREAVDPAALQQAVENVYRRFPTIICGFRPGFFQYHVVPAQAAPVVRPDPGLLIPMSREEIHSCAYRVYYRDKELIYEGFHAAADGVGAVASFTTLVAEYLRLHLGIEIPVCNTLRDVTEEPPTYELEDAYLTAGAGKPLHLPSRYSYQLPGDYTDPTVYPTTRFYPTDAMLAAARRMGVSMTAMLSGVMAQAVMEVQQRHEKKLLPVRIMVPADLRRLFPSKTLRNFILYTLPTLEPEDRNIPLGELMHRFHAQIREQMDPKRLAAIVAYNVKTQASPLFRVIPRGLKCAAMRVAYKYFGESNSSITLTNLGSFRLPVEMAPHVERLHVTLTPRAGSPYNCGVLGMDDTLAITLSRFHPQPELEDLFFDKLEQVLSV